MDFGGLTLEQPRLPKSNISAVQTGKKIVDFRQAARLRKSGEVGGFPLPPKSYGHLAFNALFFYYGGWGSELTNPRGPIHKIICAIIYYPIYLYCHHHRRLSNLVKRVDPFILGDYFHIFNRGVNRSYIFFEEENVHFFLRRLRKYVVGRTAKLIAYVLMPNHYHLLLQICDKQFSQSMQRISGLSPKKWTRKKGETGTLKRMGDQK